uniref:CUB domain-containing protein n=1 Tax=Chelydra serpentina TaxID=8475 RepID=A0A8C3RNE7_CHESE
MWETQVKFPLLPDVQLAFEGRSSTFKKRAGGITYMLLIYFHSLNCTQEFIEIYDGPLYASPLLGKICNGSNLHYVSSSNTLTVLLHRDSYYSGYGFSAYYYSICH